MTAQRDAKQPYVAASGTDSVICDVEGGWFRIRRGLGSVNKEEFSFFQAPSQARVEADGSQGLRQPPEVQ